MREPTCIATIKAKKEIAKLSTLEKEKILLDVKEEVRGAFLALLYAIEKGGNLDDWECDLGDILFKDS